MIKGSIASLLVYLATLTFLSSAEAIAGSYTTNFPSAENPISENASWIGGKTSGLDWSDFRSTPGLAFGKQPGNSSPPYDDSIALLTGTWGPTQTVQATVKTVNQNEGLFEEVEPSSAARCPHTVSPAMSASLARGVRRTRMCKSSGGMGPWPILPMWPKHQVPRWPCTTATRSNAPSTGAPSSPTSTGCRSFKARIARTQAAIQGSGRICKMQRA